MCGFINYIDLVEIKMSKQTNIIVFILFLAANISVLANSNIEGIVKTKTSEKPVIGATIKLMKASKAKYGAISKSNGTFNIEDINEGTYMLVITHVAHESFKQKITVSKDRNFGVLFLETSSTIADSINVVDKMPLMEVKGDTVSYNADAYKVNPDASSEDLIKKMPGITVGTDGNISAQGETVEQVYVDGKEFFDKNPKATLNTIPAEVVQKIEVFDEKSEQAKFTGFDDGSTTKTINIITKIEKRDGWFGKVSAGYGYEDKYQASGNINYFNGDRRISIVGLSNNVNQQNFSSDDMMGVMSSSSGSGRGRGRGPGSGRSVGENFMVNQYGGITNTNSFGVNYTDSWGEKIDVTGSYFFNMSDNTTNSSLERQYLIRDLSNQIYTEENQTESENMNHRFSFKFDWDINDNNSIMVRPKINIQENIASQVSQSFTTLISDTLNSSLYDYESDFEAINISNDILWRHKFSKPMRTFSIFANTTLYNQEGETNLFSDTYLTDEIQDNINQFTDITEDRFSYSTKIDYTEPLFKVKDGMSMLQFSYQNSYQDNSNDQLTYDYDDDSQEYAFFNKGLSNSFSSKYTYNRAEAGLMFNKGKRRSNRIFLMARVGGQYSQLDNNQTFPDDYTIEKDFANIYGMFMSKYSLDRDNNFMLMYRSYTKNPSNSQLQEVINNSDPYNLYIGNSDLENSYSHALRFHYKYTNPDNAHMFMMFLTGTLTNDYIGNNIFLANRDTTIAPGIILPTGGQFTQYTNLDGYYNMRSFLTYGLPLSAIRTNLNINASASYSHSPSMYNDEINYADNQSYGLGVVLSSNISQYVDFTLSSNSSYSNALSTMENSQVAEYYNQESSFKLNLLSKSGLVFRTDLTHQYYQGLSSDYNESYLLWNAEIGYKFLKNDQAEVKLQAFDLLKQNQSIARTVNDLYIEDSITEVLQQYVMLSFTYSIRSYKYSEEDEDKIERYKRHENMREKIGSPPNNR